MTDQPPRSRPPTPTREQRKQRSGASAWRRSDAMEALLRIRETSPDRFEEICTASLRLRLAHYLRGREAATAEGLIGSGGVT